MVRIECFDQRLQVSALDEVIALAIGKIRQRRLEALWINENIRLVGAFVYGWAANLHEPNRLRLWNPLGRRRLFDSAGPIVVPITPPGFQVLKAKIPRFALAVGNWCANLARAVASGCVVPVVTLTAGDIRLQIIEIVNRSHTGGS